jgi:hypothetical protein
MARVHEAYRFLRTFENNKSTAALGREYCEEVQHCVCSHVCCISLHLYLPLTLCQSTTLIVPSTIKLTL